MRGSLMFSLLCSLICSSSALTSSHSEANEGICSISFLSAAQLDRDSLRPPRGSSSSQWGEASRSESDLERLRANFRCPGGFLKAWCDGSDDPSLSVWSGRAWASGAGLDIPGLAFVGLPVWNSKAGVCLGVWTRILFTCDKQTISPYPPGIIQRKPVLSMELNLN